MLAGEDLPHLLQTLLVGVEHAICRIPLDELTFPPCPNVSGSMEFADYSMDEKNAASKRAECNLKRRELITKNNSINKKYAAKRSNGRDSESIEFETVDSLTASAGPTCDAAKANEGDPGAATQPSTLPLFCLGGSFPHIDSDEESGDDGKKIQTGEFSLHRGVKVPLGRNLDFTTKSESLESFMSALLTRKNSCRGDFGVCRSRGES